MNSQDCFHCADKAICGPYLDAQIEAAEHCEAMGWTAAPGERAPGCPLEGEIPENTGQ